METVVTILSVLGGLVAMAAYLRADIRRVEARVEKLDDRVYALATGLKPLIDDASRTETG